MVSVREDRMQAARRALQQAEAAAGLRTRLATGPARSPVPPRAPAPAGGPAVRPASVLDGADHLPVPDALTPLLPTVRRGGVVQVQGSTSLLLALAATAAQDGGWVALSALPDVGVTAAAEAGLALERTVLVPRPGPEAAAVLGALIDGFDVLVAGPTRALNDRDRRLLSTRLRTRGAVLLSAGSWPGSDVVLRAGQHRPVGLGDGWGSLHGQEMTVHGRGRSGVEGWVRVRLGGTGLVALESQVRGRPAQERPRLQAVS